MHKQLIKAFILYNIQHNAYYEYIADIYHNSTDDTIELIYDCFENYDCYYSIYTIMDSIEDFIETHKNIHSLNQVIYDIDFEIKEL